MPASRSSLPNSSKKRKITHNDDSMSHIQNLESQLTAAVSTTSSLNPLSDLLEVAKNSSDVELLCKAIYALYRIFVLIISNGMLVRRGSGSVDERAVQTWLMERLHEYTDLLTGLLTDEEPTLRTSALQILLSLQKHLSASLTTHSPSGSSPQPQFHISHFRKIVNALLRCHPSPRNATRLKKTKTEGTVQNVNFLYADVRESFVQTWLEVYDDIRWFFLREAGSIILSPALEHNSTVPKNLLSILEDLTTFPTSQSELNSWWVSEFGARPPKAKTSDPESDAQDDEVDAAQDDGADDWRKYFDQEPVTDTTQSKAPTARLHTLTLHQSLHSLPSHRAVFTRVWLALLPHLSSQSDESKTHSLRVLNILHRGIIPHLTRPILIMDWVGSCVDYGGAFGLLALNALFHLMKEYNLDYPSFYTRLYAFLDRDVLHLKHRARFFRLTELFLSSTHLPATLVAAFVKRLARLSLTAPPAAIVMIIPFTYNLLKTHPALMSMIHRTDSVSETESDPFRMQEANPALSDALESSLWELYTHKTHYHAVISTLTGIFEEAFTRPVYAMEDFLDHTYVTLFDTEAQRHIRREPATMAEKGLSSLQESVVTDLWKL